MYYKWSKEFLEAGKKRLAGNTERAATTDEVKGLRREARDLKEVVAERGPDVSYETARRWFLKFRQKITRNLRRARPKPDDHWHLDEMVIRIRGKRYWLWRAVDNEGEVLDFLVQPERNSAAALKLMRKLLKKQG